MDPFTGRSAYVIRDSRGLKVLQEMLGDGWNGTIVCDGWNGTIVCDGWNGTIVCDGWNGTIVCDGWNGTIVCDGWNGTIVCDGWNGTIVCDGWNGTIVCDGWNGTIVCDGWNGTIVCDGWNGTIVCDGWRPYTRYRIPHCWAHIMREMRDLEDRYPESWAAWRVEGVLSRIYADALHIPASTPKYERVPMHKLLVQRTRRLARVYADDPVIGKFMGKLNRASGDLFQFVLDPRIPPTNNAAERGLREIVVHRKIRGSIRSRETMQWMGNLFTCVTTWKAMNTDCLAEIVKRM